MLSSVLEGKNISVVTDFYVEGVDEQRNVIRSYDGREVEFDCLVVVPVNLGDELMATSGLADDMNYVQVDKQTMQSVHKPNIFAIGDAANLPTSKAGSVAHFAADVLAENIVEYAQGKVLSHQFDGHANCFIETGFGKATLIDFDYTNEPLPGRYPYAGIGPLQLLGVSRLNHFGKLAFKLIYWEFLLKDRKLPISNKFSLAGKKV
jgi:sulfide:quinone oxidoreductase